MFNALAQKRETRYACLSFLVLSHFARAAFATACASFIPAGGPWASRKMSESV